MLCKMFLRVTKSFLSHEYCGDNDISQNTCGVLFFHNFSELSKDVCNDFVWLFVSMFQNSIFTETTFEKTDLEFIVDVTSTERHSFLISQRDHRHSV